MNKKFFLSLLFVLPAHAQESLKPADYKEEIKIVEKAAKLFYRKIIPTPVFKSLQEKFPEWLPVLVNESSNPAFNADYGIRQKFYFNVPLKVDNSTVDVSIIYFFKDFNHLMNQSTSWSFWNSRTGELIFEGTTPYKAAEKKFINDPCLIPFGQDLKGVALYGSVKGSSEPLSCCGPYSLESIKKSGPSSVTLENSDASIKAFQSLCSKSTDPKTGEFRPPLKKIFGNANIRSGNSTSAPLVDKCSSKSLVAELSTKDGWTEIFCEGKIGWTINSNIRPK